MALAVPAPLRIRSEERRSAAMLPVVLVAIFMAQFDLYVVNVALPVLQVDLHAGQAALQLLVAGYAFTYAAGLITGGRLGDLFGHRRTYMAGMIAFGATSLLAGLAQTSGQLVAMRLAQGLAAAAMVPQVLGLITAHVPPAARTKALSWFGVTIGVGAVAGQVMGGILLDADVLGLGWRVIFLVNVPIALATVVLAALALPARETSSRTSLDLVGAFLLAGSLALVLVPLVLGRSQGWPAWAWVMLALAGPTLVAALRWERRVERRAGVPVLSLSLFREAAFNWGLALSLGAFASFFGFVFVLTLLLQDGLGLSPLDAGLSFSPIGVSFAAASIAAKPFAARYGHRVITAGAIVAAVGMASTSLVLLVSGDSIAVPYLLAPMAVVGLGFGTAIPVVIGAVLGKVSAEHAGSASGVLTTAQQFASAIGIAAIGGLFFHWLGGADSVSDFGHAMAGSAACSTLLLLLVIICSTRLGTRSAASHD